MRGEVTSRHLKGITELTVIADIKPDLVPIGEVLSHATRLRAVLGTFDAILKYGTEAPTTPGFVAFLDRLQTLHSVRWSIFDNDRKLLLAVSFDGAWEPYIRKIAESAGPLLDLILCNCDEYDDHSTDHGYPAFAKWVRAHQVNCEFLYVASPDTSVDDVRYLKKLERAQHATADPRAFDHDVATLRIRTPDEELPGNPDPTSLLQGSLRVLRFLYRLESLYPAGTKNGLFLLRTAHMILHPFVPGGVGEEGLRKAYARELAWFDSLEPVARPVPEGVPLQDAETVQGNILKGYGNLTHGCLLLVRLDGPAAARRFLERLRVTTWGEEARDDVKVNVAFTYRGLCTLGLSEPELSQLPKEFREGMEARAGVLGDVGPNHPSNWRVPRIARNPDGTSPGRPLRLSTVDLVIQLQRQAPFQPGDHRWSGDHPLYAEAQELLEIEGAHLLAAEVLRRKPVDGKVYEHFGYRDDLSQPGHEGPDGDRVALGELLLGYPNERGEDEEDVPSFLRNGSFLVIRKLAQDVKRFRKLLQDYEGEEEELAAKLMGRDREGRPILDPGRGATDNAFDYSSDPDGRACPMRAHIRRANPRTPRPGRTRANTIGPITPRIMRRGFSYGLRYDEAPEEEDRGLFFMAYNASIADQFEVIQRWLSGGNSTGVLSEHNDPLVGLPPNGQRRPFRFSSNDEVKRVDLGAEPLVRLLWGLYLFAPSTSALAELASRPPEAEGAATPDLDNGEALIRQLELAARVEPRETAVLHWTKVLEDPSGQRGVAPHVWAAIRERRGGVLDTPYGVLVGSADLAMQVFRDPDRYSVRAYWERMRQSLGVLYLGMDPKPRRIWACVGDDERALDERYTAAVESGQHARLSAVPNAWLAGIGREAAFERARAETRTWLQVHDGTPIDYRELAKDVLAELSWHWLALPDDFHMQRGGARRNGPTCPEDFLAVARYIFAPNPNEVVRDEAIEKGKKLLLAARHYVAEALQGDWVRENTLFAALVEASSDAPDPEAIAQTLVGAVHGLVVPTSSNFVSVLYGWIESEMLWRLQQSLDWSRRRSGVSDFERATAVLEGALVATMQANPIPSLLHRTAVRGGRIGDVRFEAGRRVVISVYSAAQGQPPDRTDVLFGGDYGVGEAPVHACPGRNMAIGILLGMATAVLECGTLEPAGRFELSIAADGSVPMPAG